jgi:hypothetical protein
MLMLLIPNRSSARFDTSTPEQCLCSLGAHFYELAATPKLHHRKSAAQQAVSGRFSTCKTKFTLRQAETKLANKLRAASGTRVC